MKIFEKDREAIDFAEEEMKRVSEEGAMVHEGKVVYDAYSNDVNINKSMTSGIKGGEWNKIQLSKEAKECEVYANLGGVLGVKFSIDLNIFNTPSPPTELTGTGLVKYQQTSGNNMYHIAGVNVTIVPSTDGFSFHVREMFVIHVTSDSYTQKQADSSYYVYKIKEKY